MKGFLQFNCFEIEKYYLCGNTTPIKPIKLVFLTRLDNLFKKMWVIHFRSRFWGPLTLRRAHLSLIKYM